jgi:prepilin-type N-terminal cleavage/methylation domain-containing protein
VGRTKKEKIMRRGATLVELLVVVSILALLAAVTIPSVRPAIESRRMREAARMVESIVSRARMEAIDRGHEFGVQLVRSARQSEACTMISLVDSGSGCYTGASDQAAARVQLWGSTSPQIIKILLTEGAIGQKILRDGDRIQFGSHVWSSVSPSYLITDDPVTPNPPIVLPDFTRDEGYVDFSAGVTTVTHGGRVWVNSHIVTAYLLNNGTTTPFPDCGPNGNTFPPVGGNWSNPVQFVIQRQPQPVRGASVTLPEGVCIDLYESGTNTEQFLGSQPVTILFGTNGSVTKLLGTQAMASGTVCMLLTTFDRLPAVPAAWGADRGPPSAEDLADTSQVDADPRNPMQLVRGWRDPRSLWIGIRCSNGQTATAQATRVDLWQKPNDVLPNGTFGYNSRNPSGDRAHMLWALRESRAGLAEPVQ